MEPGAYGVEMMRQVVNLVTPLIMKNCRYRQIYKTNCINWMMNFKLHLIRSIHLILTHGIKLSAINLMPKYYWLLII